MYIKTIDKEIDITLNADTNKNSFNSDVAAELLSSMVISTSKKENSKHQVPFTTSLSPSLYNEI